MTKEVKEITEEHLPGISLQRDNLISILHFRNSTQLIFKLQKPEEFSNYLMNLNPDAYKTGKYEEEEGTVFKATHKYHNSMIKQVNTVAAILVPNSPRNKNFLNKLKQATNGFKEVTPKRYETELGIQKIMKPQASKKIK